MPFDGTTYKAREAPVYRNPASWVVRTGMNRIAKPGCWAKAGALVEDGKTCIALSLSLDVPKAVFVPAVRALHRQAVKRNFNGVPAFNDHPDTTLADALQLMRDAIEELEADV